MRPSRSTATSRRSSNRESTRSSSSSTRAGGCRSPMTARPGRGGERHRQGRRDRRRP
ncbi:hypothetical protein [Methanoculleus chikugoensis]|uniref:hypothetical protein n=1 Tax=Methanoculleus chikugoensis TaxID=118126 RepID=UPI001FB33597|nr:hypothetical protein [Methanoculleus chikugoensis]